MGMRISWAPQSSARPLPVISVAGDVLTIDGVVYDFSPLPEGAMLPRAALSPDAPIDGEARRVGGRVLVTIALPYRNRPGIVPTPAAMVDPPAGSITVPDLTPPPAEPEEEPSP